VSHVTPLDQSQVAKIDQPISSAQRIQPTRQHLSRVHTTFVYVSVGAVKTDFWGLFICYEGSAGTVPYPHTVNDKD